MYPYESLDVEDKGYDGSPIRYLLCHSEFWPSTDNIDQAEFVVRVTPEQDFSFQVWEISTYVFFSEIPDVKDIPFCVTELKDYQIGLIEAFELLTIYDVRADKMQGSG